MRFVLIALIASVVLWGGCRSNRLETEFVGGSARTHGFKTAELTRGADSYSLVFTRNAGEGTPERVEIDLPDTFDVGAAYIPGRDGVRLVVDRAGEEPFEYSLGTLQVQEFDREQGKIRGVYHARRIPDVHEIEQGEPGGVRRINGRFRFRFDPSVSSAPKAE